jgi:PAS domain S-box-containing protein
MKKVDDDNRAGRQPWRNTVATHPHLAWTASAEGLVDYISDELADFTGRTEAELLGEGLPSVIHPDDRATYERTWRGAVDSQRPSEVDLRIRRADGVFRWFSSRAAVLRDSGGRVVKWLGAFTDIEAGKQLADELRSAKERLELAVTSSNMGIWEYDLPDGVIDNARRTYTNMWESLGYEAPTDTQASMDGLVHPDDLRIARSAIREYLAGETPAFESEVRVRHQDGAYRWRLSRGVAVRDARGTAARFIGTSVDITAKRQSEQRIRDSELQWRSLAELLPQILFRAGPDGMVHYFNRQLYEYTGIREGDLLGLDWGQVIHPDDREGTARAWLDSVASGRSHQIEHRIRSSGGSYRWFTTRAVPIRDAAGAVTGFLGSSTDIETLKRLQEELRQAKERLELAIRSSNLCIWEYDFSDGVFQNARETLTNGWESLGYDPAIDSVPTMASLIHPDDLGPLGERMMSCLSGVSSLFEAEHRVRHRNGSYRWRLGRGVAVRDASGVPIRFVGTSVDITEIKRFEDELNEAREVAESANRAKDDFLANVSHEIRTPMNAILGMTELALDFASTDHQRRLLSTVKSAARSLLGIINDVLDFSKIGAGKLALDRAAFSVRVEIGGTIRALAPRAHRKGLELVCHVRPDVPDALFGDAGRLRQILMNLVGNAIKFTPEGEVVIDVMASPESGPRSETVQLTFRIVDTGIGIAREKQAAIFRAFEQEDSSTTRRYGGTGLGLTISAQLAALMEGAITVRSEPGQGSTFEFTARFMRAAEPEVSHLPVLRSSSPVLDGLKVLVVDDNESNRRILLEWLSNWGMRPVAVGDAESAFDELAHLEEVGAAAYPLILLDARMPDIDGITLAELMRERHGLSDTKLILLSSDDSPSLVSRSREVGLHAYLPKPLQPAELLQTIHLVMNGGVKGTSDRSENGAELTRVPLPRGPARLPLRILIAEDNDFNVVLLLELLGRRGHRVTVVGDGRAALTQAMSGAFDLVLLDLHMPEMDGFEVVEAIRRNELVTGGHLPVVAVTARSSSGDRERCASAGMDDFLTKPIEPEALWAAIDRVVSAFPPRVLRGPSLIDASSVHRTCQGRPAVLERLCEAFRRSVPQGMAQVRSALRAQDPPGLRAASHKLYGTLSAFSSTAGAVAVALEDAASREDLDSCSSLVDRLESMCSDLIEDTRVLEIGALSADGAHG